jgi:hypothetical protein
MTVYPPLRIVGPTSWLSLRPHGAWQHRDLRLTAVHDLIYIASDLRTVTIPAHLAWQCSQRLDLVEDGVAYRYLTPQWYGWLHHRVRHAQALHAAGRLPAETMARVLTAWGVIRVHATDYLPAAVIATAELTYASPSYSPPKAA